MFVSHSQSLRDTGGVSLSHVSTEEVHKLHSMQYDCGGGGNTHTHTLHTHRLQMKQVPYVCNHKKTGLLGLRHNLTTRLKTKLDDDI